MNRTFFLVFAGVALIAGGIGWWIASQPEEGALQFRVEANDADKATIASLKARLEGSEDPGALAQRWLLDPEYADQRGIRSFRKLFRAHAPEGEIRLVRGSELGQPLLIRGRVVDEEGEPVPRALIYIHQVDAKGVYHPLEERAEAAARIFGYVRAGEDGRFQVRTIRPANFAYAPSTPARISLRARRTGYESVERDLRPNLYFEDDPALDPTSRAALRQEILAEKGVIAVPRPSADGPIEVEWSYTLRKTPEEE